MKKVKKLIAAAVTAALSVSAFAMPTAFAAEGDFRDVADGAWYTDAVRYVSENSVMSGTSADAFSPNAAMTRAMLTTVLYRAAGSPAADQKGVLPM